MIIIQLKFDNNNTAHTNVDGKYVKETDHSSCISSPRSWKGRICTFSWDPQGLLCELSSSMVPLMLIDLSGQDKSSMQEAQGH